jgi:hypothetical protein
MRRIKLGREPVNKPHLQRIPYLVVLKVPLVLQAKKQRDKSEKSPYAVGAYYASFSSAISLIFPGMIVWCLDVLTKVA